MATRPTDTGPAIAPPPEALQYALARKGIIPITDILDNLPWFHGPAAADWTAWRAFLCAVYGLPMTTAERELFRRCTGRTRPPAKKVGEAWIICGRRARKSAIAALLGVYEGAYRDLRGHLAPGERALIPIIAKNKKDARQLYAFVRAILNQPGLKHLYADAPTTELIQLTSDCDIEIQACTLMAARSRAIPCALNDELAFWPTSESATPDVDVLRGIRHGMANVPDPLMVGLSSPYAEAGVLFEKFDANYGRDLDDILVWKADTLTMHDSPTIRAFVAVEYEKDPVGAAAEIGANFRKDVVDFVSRDVVKECVARGRSELEPCSFDPTPEGEEPEQRFNYHAFVDVSGGSADAFTLSIAHWDPKKGKSVQDFLRAWVPNPTLNPKAVVKELKAELVRFRLTWVTGDAYGGKWPSAEFEERGIGYILSDLTKHEIYKGLLPALNSRVIELLDDADQTRELTALKRKVTPTGQERIDHPEGGHDDRINAAAGALLLAYREGQFMPAVREPERPAKTTHDIVEREFQEAIDQMTSERARAGWASRWEQ